MPRPQKIRTICLELKASSFRPQGISARDLNEIVLEVDEVEAVRLADLDGLYQAEAARRMGVSRPTFSNIIGRARAKIAQALIRGQVIRINCPKFQTQKIKKTTGAMS